MSNVLHTNVPNTFKPVLSTVLVQSSWVLVQYKYRAVRVPNAVISIKVLSTVD